MTLGTVPGRLRFLVAACVLAAMANVASVSGTAMASGLAPAGGFPPVPAGAVALGAVPVRAPLRVVVALKPRNPARLARYATAVSTHGSAVYRDFLRAGLFPRVFGPTAVAIRAVRSALRNAGLGPGTISGDHLSITVRATAGQAERAFAVRLVRYRLPGGRIAFANASPPLLPAAAARYVQAVIGLDDLYLPRPASVRLPQRRPAALARITGAPRPGAGTGGPQLNPTCAGSLHDGYTATQLASAYDFPALYQAGDLGAGMTIGLIELQPYLASDIASYKGCYLLGGQPLTTTVTNVPVPGTNPVSTDPCQGNTGCPEPTMDIEDAAGLAPLATIDVYQGTLPYPDGDEALYDDEQQAVEQDAAQVLSISYGDCEPNQDNYSNLTSAEYTVFEQAAVQGQTVLAASGDWGSEDCFQDNPADTALEVNDPASQPYVTGVGGTTFSGQQAITWNACYGKPTSCATSQANLFCNMKCASGGGISTLWPMPGYQLDAPSGLHVISSLSSTVRKCPGAGPGRYCREVPDVSANAGPGPNGAPGDGDGYAIYLNDSWTDQEGTSLAAPLWAAGISLIDEQSGDIGFANPALYAIAGSSSYATAFHDVMTGDNDFTGTSNGDYPAAQGYDMATGLGTPDFGGLAAAADLYLHTWKSQPFPQPTDATSVNFGGVSCTKATACTAVGSYFKAGEIYTLAEGWNGHTWSIEPTLNPSDINDTQLTGVSCTSPTACTAVGLFWAQRSSPSTERACRCTLLAIDFRLGQGSASGASGTRFPV